VDGSGTRALEPAVGGTRMAPESGTGGSADKRGPASEGGKAAEHEAKRCRECNAPIFWAQVLEKGQRVFVCDARTGRRRVKSIPVDCEPTAAGTVVLFQRAGEGIVCKMLRAGEAPPGGGKLRTFHRCSNRGSAGSSTATGTEAARSVGLERM
jgi:hypothetical protein